MLISEIGLAPAINEVIWYNAGAYSIIKVVTLALLAVIKRKWR